jgi:hypothetical protein
MRERGIDFKRIAHGIAIRRGYRYDKATEKYMESK